MGQKLTRYAITEKVITLADSPYTATPNYNCIKVNTTGGNVRVNLPDADYPIDVIKTSSDSYIVTVWVGGTQIGEVAGELSKITIENAEVTKDEPWYPYDAIVGIAGVSGDGGEVLAKDRFGRVIAGGRGVAGTDDITVLESAFGSGNRIVQLGVGTFTHADASVVTKYIPSGVTLRGSGQSATTIKNTILRVDASNVTVDNFAITSDIAITGGVHGAIRIGACDSFVARRLYIHNWNGAGIYFYPEGTVNYPIVEQCLIVDIDGHGIALNGTGGSYTIVEGKYVYDNCLINGARILHNRVLRAGYASTRLYSWAVGIDANEHTNTYDCLFLGNYVGYCWTDGFHQESRQLKTGIRFIGNHSEYNGQNPVSDPGAPGAGFLVSGGVEMVGNKSNHNYHGISASYIGRQGLVIADHVDDSSTAISYRIITDNADCRSVEFCNLNNIISRDAGRIGLYLYGVNKCTGRQVQIINPTGHTAGCVQLVGSSSGPDILQDCDMEVTLHGGGVDIGIYSTYSNNLRLAAKVIGNATITKGIRLSTGVTNAVLDGCDINSSGDHGISCVNAVALVRNSRIRNNIVGSLAYGVYNESGSTITVDVPTMTIDASTVTVPYYLCRFNRNSGSSTGTGSEQAIPHDLAVIPTGCKAWITYLVGTRYVTEMIPFDATNVYPTVATGTAYNWRIE